MNTFWQQLPKPFFVQAPMEDVTDAAFRKLIAHYGKPHVMYTEFTSADGLLLADNAGKEKLLKKLLFSDPERPIVAQLFTSVPERMEQAAKLCAELGFDGIDINMGCPDRAVEKSGSGASLIKTPSLARELIRAAKRGACRCGSQTCTSEKCLPISVKTRLGYNTDTLETWLPELLAEEPAAIAIHARTRKEMSLVPARWERIKRAVELRDQYQGESLIKTLIIGNGDVRDLADAREKAAATDADGVMLGRAIYGNPWLFAARALAPAPRERIEALAEHLRLFEELLGDTTHYATMKKHFKAYLSGWDGAKELRMRLMETESVEAALNILKDAVYFPA